MAPRNITLVAELSGSLRLWIHSCDHPEGFTRAGRVFSPLLLGRPGFLGFYDWLRDSHGVVAGIRLTLASDADGLRELVPRRDYIAWYSDHVFDILFYPAVIDQDLSVDQDFLTTRVFQGSDGSIALTVDAGYLTDQELSRIRGAAL